MRGVRREGARKTECKSQTAHPPHVSLTLSDLAILVFALTLRGGDKELAHSTPSNFLSVAVRPSPAPAPDRPSSPPARSRPLLLLSVPDLPPGSRGFWASTELNSILLKLPLGSSGPASPCQGSPEEQMRLPDDIGSLDDREREEGSLMSSPLPFPLQGSRDLRIQGEV
eukprot:747410-Hanusia_phi.AAC.5